MKVTGKTKGLLRAIFLKVEAADSKNQPGEKFSPQSLMKICIFLEFFLFSYSAVIFAKVGKLKVWSTSLHIPYS